ncbi:hypothetical protein R3P38DRAFT_3616746 [Favolaschia claudopus]|uniref:Structure-specific endonuclease subunit SLX4 n=1 Tax=Favolaschia claudopus TaxID=2862362 RepID=A0AAW0A264_9AGAR
MPKLSRKQVAAKDRHRKKRGEISPEELTELQKDGSYIPDSSDAESAEAPVSPKSPSFTERIANVFRSRSPTPISRAPSPPLDPDLQPDWEAVEVEQSSRKRKAEDADLVHDVSFGKSTSSVYRAKNLKTKKARAQAMQRSISSIFSRVTKKEQAPPEKETEKQDEPDSDIEDSDIEMQPIEPEISQEQSVPLFANFEAALTAARTSTNIVTPIVIELEAAPEPTSDQTPISVEPTESPPIPDLSDTNFDDLDRVSDAAAASDGVTASRTPKDVQTYLNKLIKKHEKELRKPKTMISDKNAANKIFDLEALKQYNDLRFKYSEKIWKARKAVEAALPGMKPLLRRKIPTFQPSIIASEKVADSCSKGPSFARRLRKLAVFLTETGELPESRQGQGAFHASLFNDPAIVEALRVWTIGSLSVEEGGFEGPIRPRDQGCCPCGEGILVSQTYSHHRLTDVFPPPQLLKH